MKRKKQADLKPKYRVTFGSGFNQECFTRTDAVRLVEDILRATTYSYIIIEKL